MAEFYSGLSETKSPIHWWIIAPAFSFIHHPQPELGSLGLFNPKAQNVLCTVWEDAQSDVDRLVTHKPLIADLHPQAIEKHDWIADIQRSVLPFGDLFQHRSGASHEMVCCT